MNNSKLYFMLMALLVAFMASCESSQPGEEPGGGRPSRPDVDEVKVLSHRHCHALKDLAGDALGLEFEQIVFEYTSVGPDMSTPVRLTGSISMHPKVYNKSTQPRAVMLYNQFTATKRGDRTSQDRIDDIGLYMNRYQGLVIVSPDLYGWTLTADKPQTYCCPEVIARESVDCWDAAMTVLANLRYNVGDALRFNVGYSAGGYSAMAVQRYVDQQRSDLTFDFTAAGAAPFDICTIYRDYVDTDVTGFLTGLPLMVVAYHETYHLGFTYDEVFQPPLCDNIEQWILSKNYTADEVSQLIGAGKRVSEVLTPAACDTTTGVGKMLYDKFRSCSLCGPGQQWQPSTRTRFYIMHSQGDTYMTYTAGQQMASYLRAHGCQVDTDFRNSGDHVKYGFIDFTTRTILKMEKLMGNTYAPQLQSDVLKKVNDLKPRLFEHGSLDL